MRATRALRLGAAALVLGVLVGRFGTGPFVEAVGRVTSPALLVAVIVTVLTTTACAARWVWVARRLDLELGLGGAVAGCYRSIFLNQVLPGGVLGDVDRAVRQGAVRAVAWERVLGQVGLFVVSAVVLLAVPSPVPRSLVAAIALGVTAVGVVVARWVPRRLLTLAAWQPLLLSVAAVAGHLVVLLVAVHAVLPDAALPQVLPLLVAVLVASSLPTNLAGWGPREGAAAALFGAAGLGADHGITVAATYGVLSLLAALPGALLVLADAWPRRQAVSS